MLFRSLVFNGHQHWYERMNAIRGVYHVTTGAGGQSLYAPTSREPYSAVLRNDVYSFTLGEVTGSRLKLQQISDAGVVIDEFNLDLSHPFRIDGLLDDPAWLRADNGLKLYAAIRGNYLYVATLDAGEGNDHFIYLNNQISTNRPANWAKAGQVMQWNALLADENDGAFQGWFDSTEAQRTNFPAFQSMTSGLNNNDPTGNGVLEGTVDILERFGSFPPVLYLQAAAYQTADGGSRVVDAPAGQFLVVNTRDLALDLPVANAGTNYTLEAGLPAVLNGTGSSAPSGLPLAFNWIQIAGDPVALINSNSAAAGFTPLSAGARTFQLTVSDTRFTSNATVTVTAIAPIDTDGDGLTDQEELTGQDNILTVPIPAALTNPYNPDTDGDGQSDGAEALAGTNPNDPGSALKIVRITGQCLVEWTTVAGKTYQVQTNSTPVGAWQPFTNLTATFTGTTNVVDLSAGAVTNRFYRVVVP